MNFLRKHWNGGYSIDRSFLVNGFLLPFASFVLLYFFIGLLFGGKVPAAAQILLLILQDGFFVWWFVGMWRCCKNPVNNNNGKKKFRLIKSYMVVLGLFAFFQIVAELFTIGTQGHI
jgi:hypothetical protein